MGPEKYSKDQKDVRDEFAQGFIIVFALSGFPVPDAQIQVSLAYHYADLMMERRKIRDTSKAD